MPEIYRIAETIAAGLPGLWLALLLLAKIQSVRMRDWEAFRLWLFAQAAILAWGAAAAALLALGRPIPVIGPLASVASEFLAALAGERPGPEVALIPIVAGALLFLISEPPSRMASSLAFDRKLRVLARHARVAEPARSPRPDTDAG